MKSSMCTHAFLALAAALVMGAAAFPAMAMADDGSQSPSVSSSASSSEIAPASSDLEGSSTSSSAKEVEEHDYSAVLNEQVFGDFYFIMCVDTALLAMCLGAMGWICFRRG